MTQSDTKARQRAVLIAYMENYANVKKACEEVGISRETFYKWKKRKWFGDKLKKIDELLVGELESLAISRSFEGSDTMLKFLLTKLRSGTYGNKIDIKLDERTLSAILRGLPDEFRKGVIAELEATFLPKRRK